MEATTASAILAKRLRARGMSVRKHDEETLSVANPLHPRVGEIVTAHGGLYLTDYGYEVGEHGDEHGTVDRIAFLLGLPRLRRRVPQQSEVAR